MRKAEQKQEEKQVIKIKEDVKINENTILEPGDKIEVLKEVNYSELTDNFMQFLQDNVEGYGGPGPDTHELVFTYDQLLQYIENDLRELGLNLRWKVS